MSSHKLILEIKKSYILIYAGGVVALVCAFMFWSWAKGTLQFYVTLIGGLINFPLGYWVQSRKSLLAMTMVIFLTVCHIVAMTYGRYFVASVLETLFLLSFIDGCLAIHRLRHEALLK